MALLEQVPTAVQYFFGVVGFGYVSWKFVSFLQLILSSFVLSGTNVSISSLMTHLGS